MGEMSEFVPLLPAAQTFTMPRDSTAAMAAFKESLKPPPPQELLVTRILVPTSFSSAILLNA